MNEETMRLSRENGEILKEVNNLKKQNQVLLGAFRAMSGELVTIEVVKSAIEQSALDGMNAAWLAKVNKLEKITVGFLCNWSVDRICKDLNAIYNILCGANKSQNSHIGDYVTVIYRRASNLKAENEKLEAELGEAKVRIEELEQWT